MESKLFRQWQKYEISKIDGTEIRQKSRTKSQQNWSYQSIHLSSKSWFAWLAALPALTLQTSLTSLTSD